MASQGQAVARQQNRWLERFVIALAIAAIMITLGWGAFTALSAPSTVAPSKTTTQILLERGLREQRAGERAGASGGYVVRTAPRGKAVAQPVRLPKLHPYVSIRPKSVPGFTIMTDGLVEHRGMEPASGTSGTGVSVHPRGHSSGRD
jgi:hypothetical protein